MATSSGNQEAGINPKLPTWNGEWRTCSDYRLAVELEADGSKEEELQYLGPDWFATFRAELGSRASKLIARS